MSFTNSHISDSLVVLKVTTSAGDRGADDNEREETTDGTGHEKGSSTDSVQQEDGGEGEDGVDDTVHSCGEKRGGVGVKTEASEDFSSSAVVSRHDEFSLVER